MGKVTIFKNFLNSNECDDWITKAPQFNGSYNFDDRVLDITNYEIVNTVKNFLENFCNCKLTCSQAQIQLWPIDSMTGFHIHNDLGRHNTDYNSLLYLNDDFDGGEFMFKQLFFRRKVKPEKGMLTFFDGSKIYHAVNRVKKKHRYSLIFWWENTIFY